MAGGTGTKEFVNSVNLKHYLCPVNIVHSVAPRNRVRVDTVPPLLCAVQLYKLYIVFMTQCVVRCTCVYIVHSLYDTTVALATTQKGDPNGPLFYPALRGILFLRPGQDLQFVHIVQSTWRHNCRSPFYDLEKGTRTVPLILIIPAGIFITSTRTGAASFCLLPFGPMVHL